MINLQELLELKGYTKTRNLYKNDIPPSLTPHFSWYRDDKILLYEYVNAINNKKIYITDDERVYSTELWNDYSNNITMLGDFEDYTKIYTDTDKSLYEKDSNINALMRNDTIFNCYDCDRYFTVDDNEFHHIDNYVVCEQCRYDNYSECDYCGNIVHNDYIYYDDYDNVYCEDCWENNQRGLIWDYHVRPKYNLFGDTSHTYGIELEVDTMQDVNHIDRNEAAQKVQEHLGEDHVYFNEDGSLSYSGFEIITHPHSMRELLALDWENTFKDLSHDGFRSHQAKTCGLHIHIGRTNFGNTEEEQNTNIAKLYVFFNKWWVDIVKMSRRTNYQLRWCNKNDMQGVDLSVDNWHESSDIEKIKGIVERKSGDHSVAINNSNHNTVEIRVPRGTLKYSTFRATLLFFEHIVKKCVEIPDKTNEILDLDNWLKDMPLEVITYLASREAFNYSNNEGDEE